MQDTINLKDLYLKDEDFLKSLTKATKLVKKYSKYQNHLFDDANTLLEFLEFDTNLGKELEKLYLYAHINNDLDMTNEKYQNYLGQVQNLFNTISELSSFVVPEILTHNYAEFEQFSKINPKLKAYKRTIKHLFRDKKYIKSKQEEELIATLTSSYNKPEMISEYLINADLNYGTIKDEHQQEVKLTNSNYSTYVESSLRRVRQEAFNTLYQEFKAHENTFASILATEIINNNKLAKIRGFKSAREYSLFQNDVNNKIYDELITNVSKNLPKFVKYFDLKKKILGLDEMHIYDTYAKITSEYTKKYSYEEAKNIILDSLAILGPEYQSLLNRAFNEGWIDAKIRDKKRDGGYCTCAYLAHPYIVVNYEQQLNDVSTLAHELGHAIHYYYAQTNNSYQDYNYSIFVAEVASQVNEIILTDYLLKNSNNKEEKKYILDLIIQRFKATIIRQTMFAEYEDKIHKLDSQNIPLTKDLLVNEYYKLNQKYFGDRVTIDDYIKYECFRIPHFYYNFYVYQYATGYAAAMKIATDIINHQEGALEKYLKFLRLGATKNPCDSLKVAGVDMKDSKIYDDIFNVFETKLSELRSLYE